MFVVQHCPLVSSIAVTVFVVTFASSLDARSCRPNLIPNGGIDNCSSCHVNARGGGPRTPFGEDVLSFVLPGSCDEFWSSELAAMDSDLDGRTNGEELLDPNGTWQSGDAHPGDPFEVTNPGVFDEFGRREIEASPRVLDFGPVAIGESRVLNVTVESLGEQDLTLTAIELGLATSTEFSVVALSLPIVLAQGETQRIEIRFAPDDEGAEAGELLLTHDGESESSPIRISLSGSTPVDGSAGFLRGDVNLDGRVDIGDAVRLLGFLFRGGIVLGCRDAADPNDSGSIDLGDPIFELNWLFRAGLAPPAPGPAECGVDPTDDDLDCVSYPPCAA